MKEDTFTKCDPNISKDSWAAQILRHLSQGATRQFCTSMAQGVMQEDKVPAKDMAWTTIVHEAQARARSR